MEANSPPVSIQFDHNRKISPEEFIDLLRRSGLAERRPVGDAKCIEAMLAHADLICTAWDGDRLVGVARSVTDFEYCCYLSDLAVDRTYQNHGVGKQLIRLTQSRLGAAAKNILLSAPKATGYYPKIGFEPHLSAWFISARKELS